MYTVRCARHINTITATSKSGKPLEELSPPRNDFLFGHGLILMTHTAEFNIIFVASYSFFASSS